MGVLLVVVLYFQCGARRYVSSLYWLAVVLVRVSGILITDNLGISLAITTGVFGAALAVVFAL